jgi:hypothetical protein
MKKFTFVLVLIKFNLIYHLIQKLFLVKPFEKDKDEIIFRTFNLNDKDYYKCNLKFIFFKSDAFLFSINQKQIKKIIKEKYCVGSVTLKGKYIGENKINNSLLKVKSNNLIDGIFHFWPNNNIKNEYSTRIYSSVHKSQTSYNSDSIKCIKIQIVDDVAIGYHDFFSTSSTNFGNAIQLAAYTVPGALGGLNQNRALFKFNIPKELDSVKILSAELNLFATGPLGNLSGHTGSKNKGIIQMVTQPWNENTATWDNQPKSSIINQVLLENPGSETQDYQNINILSLFQDLQRENLGLILKQTDEFPTNALLFCSSDFPNPGKHPYIEVCYNSDPNDNNITNQSCDFIYYPNPTSQKLHIKFNKYDNNTKKEFNIYSLSGQLINRYELNYPLTTLELRDFPSGVYIADISTGSCNRSFKFEVINN